MNAFYRRTALAILIFCVFPPLAHAGEWSGKCVGVSDGDTITVLKDGKAVKIRVYGVDCPENGQDFGARAKSFTSGMVYGKTVTVKHIDTDRYKRVVGTVHVDGKSLSRELIAHGYGWVYTKYCTIPECEEWRQLEVVARENRLGLWEHPNPVPPWEWRKTGGRPIDPNPASYHGNTTNHVFHKPSCKAFNCKNCTAKFETREQAVAGGYRPCGTCKP